MDDRVALLVKRGGVVRLVGGIQNRPEIFQDNLRQKRCFRG